MGRSKQTFFQRRCIDGQEAHEKMLNITNYQGNANQNYNEVPPHTNQNGYNLNTGNTPSPGHISGQNYNSKR